MRRTVNDLVMAEMFLVQATIESAAAIGDGLNELGRQLSAGNEEESSPWDTISGVLQRTADEALEPYTTRFRYLRDILGNDK
jgi:hypothetical protein